MSRRSSAGSRSRSARSPSYCSNCGEKLAESMNFCPNCGANCEEPSRPRRREPSVSDRDVLEYRISKAVEAGWELEHDFGDRAVMIRRNYGGRGMHVLIFLFTFWWTMGAGNALYALYCYFGATDRMVLRAEHVDASTVRSIAGAESGTGSVGVALLCWLGMLIALAIATSATSVVWTGVFAGASIALGLVGLAAVPPIRRRLENRRSIATNGWTRSVRERAVLDPDEPCTNCAGPIDRGVERTYQKAFAVLGVPVTTSVQGTNRYCRRCANAEFDRPDRPSSPNRDPSPGPSSELPSEVQGEGDADADTNTDTKAESTPESDPSEASDDSDGLPDRDDGDEHEPAGLDDGDDSDRSAESNGIEDPDAPDDRDEPPLEREHESESE